ncbi:ABC transporter substrate-binding protein [Nocardiopsis changdeensis]|uniref:ABC transporter substrate-binding protein n=1 Tax=Nocardiopsis changdeensis TaxID=2831969 RepID=A0ABX8BLH7_9ACTN|nr:MULTISPECIES: ABC transporter substrate-binding protein [Nocardiopsis]QUX23085.1 ABC transporter substrate-binding protein [Nocardiopsis changdeensis]QYX39030.1 ABC transporter substrate-binding protein [Nocardiopsis sp. MT53]
MCRGPLVRILAAATAVALVSSCAVRTDQLARNPGTVRMALNGWVGYEASAEVLAYILREEMDYQVQLVRVDEQPSWQAIDQGVIDVIVENWGHEDLMELYGPEGNGTVVDGGPNGNEGVIGWYVPAYVAEEYPEITTLEGLRENTDVFRTAETGDRGEFLGGAPGFVTQDQGMINAFGLDLEIVFAGSEPAQITEVRRRYAAGEPVLFYFYDPQWLQEELDLVKVDLPDHEEGCDADPDSVPCDYPAYDLNKIFRAGFVEENDPAYRFLDNWTWTNADQNEVARMIADEGLDPTEAAEIWVRENPDVWRPWLPEGFGNR